MLRALLPFAFLLGACGAPVISDVTGAPWPPGAAREFRLAIDRPFLTSVDAVRLRYARHLWPGAEKAHEAATGADGAAGDIPAGTGAGGVAEGWKAIATDLADAPKSHHLFYRWEVDYTRPFGLGAGTVTTDLLDFTIGCTPEMRATQLQDMQTAVLAAHDLTDPTRGALPYLPHGRVSIEDTGVGFAHAAAAAVGQFPGYPTSLDPFQPAIVLYRPRPPKTGDETAAQYFDAITDATGSDAPYRIIGWAYGAPYDPTQRPLFGCIPSSAWFVHEAGYHLTNGAMALYPVSEALPGAATVGGVLPPPGFAAPANATFWHGRAWDLHIWLAPDGGVTPVISRLSPEPVPGIPVTGLFFPAGTFE